MRIDTIILFLAAFAVMAGAIALNPREGDAKKKKPDAAPPAPPVPAETPPVRDISPEEARKRLSEDGSIVLLDVRTPEEYAEGHISGSVLLPLAEDAVFAGRAGALIPERGATVFVYCRSGRRSRNAAEILNRHGYTNVFNLGGIQSWPFGTEKGAAPSGK